MSARIVSGHDSQRAERDRVIETVGAIPSRGRLRRLELVPRVVTEDVGWLISISDGSLSLVHDFSGAENIVEYLRLVVPGATPHHHTTKPSRRDR